SRMQRALREYEIQGIKSNIAFFLDVLGHPEFQKGVFDTGFIDRLKTKGTTKALRKDSRDLAAIAAAMFHSERSAIPEILAKQICRESSRRWRRGSRRRGLSLSEICRGLLETIAWKLFSRDTMAAPSRGGWRAKSRCWMLRWSGRVFPGCGERISRTKYPSP